LEKEKEMAKAVAEVAKPMIDRLLKKIDRLLFAGAADAARGNDPKDDSSHCRMICPESFVV